MSPTRVTCFVEIHPHTEELEPRGTVEKRNQREVVRRQKVQRFEAGSSSPAPKAFKHDCHWVPVGGASIWGHVP